MQTKFGQVLNSYNATIGVQGSAGAFSGTLDASYASTLKTINQNCHIEFEIYTQGRTNTAVGAGFITKNDPGAIDTLISKLSMVVDDLSDAENAVPVDYKFAPTASYIVGAAGSALNVSGLLTSLKEYFKCATAKAKLESIVDAINNHDPAFEYLQTLSKAYYKTHLTNVNPLVVQWEQAVKDSLKGSVILPSETTPVIYWPHITVVVEPVTWTPGAHWPFSAKVYGGEELFFGIEQYRSDNSLYGTLVIPTPADPNGVIFHSGNSYDFYYDITHSVGARNDPTYFVVSVYDRLGKPLTKIRINGHPPAGVV